MIKKQIFLFFILIISTYGNTEKNSPFVYPSIIEIAYLEETTLPITDSFRRFLTMNPKSISISHLKNKLFIKALNVGTSTLLIWTDKRIQIQIKVIPPPKRRSLQQQRLDQMIIAQNAVSFTTYFSFRRSAYGKDIGDMNSPVDSYGAGLGVRIPFFKGTSISLLFDVDTQLNGNNLTLSSGSLNSITWPKSQRYSIKVGNISDSSSRSSYSNYSSIKGVIVDPLRLRLHKRFNPIRVKFTYGEKEQRTGSFISWNHRDLLTSNTEGNSLVNSKKSKFLKVSMKYKGKKRNKHRYKKNWSANIHQDLDIKDDFFYNFNFGLNNIKESINLGLGGQTDQTSYDIFYSRAISRTINCSISRSYVPNKFTTSSSNSILYENINHTANLTYSPNFKLENFEFNSFSSSFSTAESKRSLSTETRNSYRFQSGIRLYDYILTMGYSINDSKKTIHPMESDNINLRLMRSFKYRIPFRCSIRYAKVERTRFEEITKRTKSLNFGYHFSVKIFKNLSYSLSNSTSRNEANNDSQKGKSISHSLNYSFDFFRNLIKGNCNYRYSKNQNDSSLISDSITNSIKTSLSSRIHNNANFKLSYLLEMEKKEHSDDNKARSIIEASITSRFHTFFGWEPKTEIDVLAFYDVNSDGKYNEDIDRPLKKAVILVNEEISGKTDASGMLYLGKIKGFNKVISISRDSIPDGFVFSTSSKYTFNKLKTSKETCFFGLILNTEISGTIYNDLNGNAIFDKQDEPLSGITVSLASGKTIITNANGRYYFSPVMEGEHEIKIDALSLPIGFRSISRSKKIIQIEKGSIIKENFGFQAIRILKVKLFVQNGRQKNQLFNIEIMLNDIKKKAKRKGIYKFSRINYGTQILAIPLDELSFKVRSCSPKPLDFNPEKSKFIKIPIFFDKNPETKNISIFLERIS